MATDFRQLAWDAELEQAARRAVEQALEEDLGTVGDLTSAAVVPAGATGAAQIVVRSAGIVAGLRVAALVAANVDSKVEFSASAVDGASLQAGSVAAEIRGLARSILAAERVMLNFVGRLSGIATLTGRYVSAVEGTRARIYDTRKTTPGLRLLEKHAVHLGGGHNHRRGLFDAVLIKDNHLAIGRRAAADAASYLPGTAVARARRAIAELKPPPRETVLVEIELDDLESLPAVLAAGPDIVMLDNMSPPQLERAVALRDAQAPQVELEASGGVRLETIAAIARTGVDRISVGALTHSAPSLDVGLDWVQ